MGVEYPLLGTKICAYICPRTFSVPGCEQLMSKDKNPFIFSRKIEAIVFINVQTFCKAREKMFGEYRLGDILGYHLVFAGDIRSRCCI